MKTREFTTECFSALQSLAVVFQTGETPDILRAISDTAALDIFQSKGWQYNFRKLSEVVAYGKPRFTILKTDGNSKLPFVAFSTLPGVTCPGAGACLDFCYSFRAWRYPAAFMRQCQNAYLMRFDNAAIVSALDAVSRKKKFRDGFDFRLYVDGDFSCMADVDFWMATLANRPAIRCYGYSKSFDLLLQYSVNTGGQWPENYRLNISSGHNSGADVVSRMHNLPITRGEFVAVSIGRKIKASDYGTKETNDAIRAAFPEQKVFPCPGKCGSCTNIGHACGSAAFNGKIIAIAVH